MINEVLYRKFNILIMYLRFSMIFHKYNVISTFIIQHKKCILKLSDNKISKFIKNVRLIRIINNYMETSKSKWVNTVVNIVRVNSLSLRGIHIIFKIKNSIFEENISINIKIKIITKNYFNFHKKIILTET